MNPTNGPDTTDPDDSSVERERGQEWGKDALCYSCCFALPEHDSSCVHIRFSLFLILHFFFLNSRYAFLWEITGPHTQPVYYYYYYFFALYVCGGLSPFFFYLKSTQVSRAHSSVFTLTTELLSVTKHLERSNPYLCS